MFFQKMALFCLLLLMSGCVCRTLQEDPTHLVAPDGATDVINRSINPRLYEFARELNYDTFTDDRSYSGYYIPLLGISIDRAAIGRDHFEPDLVHEILHAVHFNGLVDKDALQAAIDRLFTDPAHAWIVEAVNAQTWDRWIYSLFEQSEYFARIGALIVEHHGIGIPDYLWVVFGDVLHPSLRENGARYPTESMPENATMTLSDGTNAEQPLLASVAGVLPRSLRVMPRRDIVNITARLNIATDSDRPLLVQFIRRSTRQIITSCAGRPVVSKDNPDDRRLDVLWTASQARDIMAAWQAHDLDIVPIEPVVAFGPR